MGACKWHMRNASPHSLATHPTNQPQICETMRSVTFDLAPFWDVVNIKVEPLATHRINESAAISVEETLMDAITLATDFVDFENKSTLKCLMNVWLPQIIDIRQQDSYSKTLLSILSYLFMFTVFIARRTVIYKSIIVSVLQIAKNLRMARCRTRLCKPTSQVPSVNHRPIWK